VSKSSISVSQKPSRRSLPVRVRGQTDTANAFVSGTAPYMSPEQARGREVDFRSDQFSFGLVLYEMAAGARAFSRDTPVQTLLAIIEDDPPPLAQANPRVPVPLRWIVDRCLAKDPRQRYAATADLAHDLRTLRDRLAEAIATGTTLVRAIRWRAKHWMVATAGVGGAAALHGVFPRHTNRHECRFTGNATTLLPVAQLR
jgi:serine/threonine protein kinase